MIFSLIKHGFGRSKGGIRRSVSDCSSRVCDGVDAGVAGGPGASARERVEVLREKAARAVAARAVAARAVAALEAGEIELDRRVIAREELVETVAASATETTGITKAEGEGETALVPAPASAAEPGAFVPHWREGLSVSALAGQSADLERASGPAGSRAGAG
ncbi:hypothetical protein [Streptomyces rubrogriseus]|uniref:hypothetical protein n=1 Tax=Streptomyces rubrogriseus TaxID=194673 RepID=UPI00378B3F87